MAIEVRSIAEMKQAMAQGAQEIIVKDDALATKLRAVLYFKKRGPLAVGVVVAAIPAIVATGGAGGAALAIVAPTAAWSVAAIVALVVATGATIAISIFTDWDVVEVPGLLRLVRNQER